MAAEDVEVWNGFSEWLSSLRIEVSKEVGEITVELRNLPTLPLLAQLSLAVHGGDPDDYSEAKTEYHSVGMEWATAVVLTLQEPRPIEEEGFAESLPVMAEIPRRLRALFSSVLMLVQVPRRQPTSPEGETLARLGAYSRSYHTVVRSPAYDFQERQLLDRLFRPFAESLRTLQGFTAQEALEFASRLPLLINDRLQELRREAREYAHRVAPENELSEDERLDASSWWGNLHLDLIFNFEPADICGDEAAAAAFLDAFSLGFGQSIAPRPADPNPVTRAPLVRLEGGRFFCHMAGLLLWAFRARFETVLKTDQGSWTKYERHRANLLEQLTEENLQKAMPAAKLERNLTFVDSEDRAGELDLLCTIDRTLILCESKAGTISPSARYGARLRRALKANLGVAHGQGLRAHRHIREGSAVFRRKDASELTIREEDYERLFIVLVTLDDISAFATNLSYLTAVGLFNEDPQPWATSVLDLETIADLCDLNVILPHFLVRRTALHRHGDKLHASDELDWFMHYLRQGLYFDDDLHEIDGLHLSSHTGTLDDYYLFQQGVRTKPAHKPTINLERDFRLLIEEVEKQRVPGWLEIALKLIDYGSPTRRLILRNIRDLRRKSKRAGRVLAAKGNSALMLYSLPGDADRLFGFMDRYAKAHIVSGNYSSAGVIGVSSLYPNLAPQFLFIQRSAPHMPTVSQAERTLSFYSGEFRQV